MASARTIVPCPEGAWTIVSTNKTTATIHTKITSRYFHNFALTGQPAPTTLADGIFFRDSVEFNNTVAIDIYIWCQGKAGSVGVDD